MHNNEHEEIMVLSHDAWPGFKKAFLIAFSAGLVYLAVILLSSFSHMDEDAGTHGDSHHGSVYESTAIDFGIHV